MESSGHKVCIDNYFSSQLLKDTEFKKRDVWLMKERESKIKWRYIFEPAGIIPSSKSIFG